jgi:hypothetical protein
VIRSVVFRSKTFAVIQRVKEQKEAEEKKKQQDLLNYVGFMDSDRMKSNKDADLADLEDDFM